MVSEYTDKESNYGVSDERYMDASYLASYVRQLEKRVKTIETEKKLLDAERMRLERELNSVRAELERLRLPPLFTGTVLEVLEADKGIIKSSTGPTLVVQIAKHIPKDDLPAGTRVALNQRSFALMDILPMSKDPTVLGMELEERPNVTYKEIGGLREQIQELREMIELPLNKPHLFEEVGIDPPKGVLLHGPPGTGKTLLTKAVAHETNATFIRIIGSELVQKYIGEGARLVREIFKMAKERAPSIVFIDELDAIGSKRLDMATSGDREVQRTLRPGRFDRIIEIPMPTSDALQEIYKIHTRKMKLSNDIKIPELVVMSENASGADIKAITTEAGMFAIREERSKVTLNDFTNAIDKVLKKQGFNIGSAKSYV
jgi:proteasome regulatory subunit